MAHTIHEFEECVCPFLLLLLAVQRKHGEVDIVEQLRMVVDTGATAEEYCRREIQLAPLTSSEDATMTHR